MGEIAAVIVIAILILVMEKAYFQMIVQRKVIVCKDIGAVNQSGLDVDYFS